MVQVIKRSPSVIVMVVVFILLLLLSVFLPTFFFPFSFLLPSSLSSFYLFLPTSPLPPSSPSFSVLLSGNSGRGAGGGGINL